MEDRIFGLLYGVAVGDAKGIPFELRTYYEMKAMDPSLFDPSTKYIDCPPDHHMYGLKAGQCTDDTQLTLATANAIASSGTFDINAIAREHVRAMHESTVGWGSGTTRAVESLSRRTHLPSNSGNKDAVGNSVLKKLSPLVLLWVFAYRGDRFNEKFSQIEQLTRMTHDNAKCVIAAATFAFAIEKLFTDVISRNDGKCMLDTAEGREQFLRTALDYSQRAETILAAKRANLPNEPPLSKRISDVIAHKNRLHIDEVVVEFSCGGDNDSYNSLVMVLSLLAAKELSFDSILRAAFIGGDTDSNASMVGAVYGFCRGFHALPKEYIEKLTQKERIEEVAVKLTATLRRISQHHVLEEVQPPIPNSVIVAIAILVPILCIAVSIIFK